MIDFKALSEKNAKYRAFCETDLGAAFLAYENAMIAYWREDSNDRISYAKLSALDKASYEARERFLALLMEPSP